MEEWKKGEEITAAIRAAVADDSRRAVIRGKYEISEAIRIPSRFTLVLRDCHLRLADGCFCNLFINEHCDTPSGRCCDGTDRDIHIVGEGRAVLDGGRYNGLSEKTQNTNGLPPIWKNNLLLFANVDGFSVTGIHCRNQRHWALNFIDCRNGVLRDIDFCSDHTAINAQGEQYDRLLRSAYRDILVKNSDGIDIRRGCHDILIENITGFTEDDTVALTGLCGDLERHFGVEELPSDICRITVRNVTSAAYCTGVRLLNQGGVKLYDILIDGVRDTGLECPYLDRGLCAVRIGDTHLYGTRHATREETHHITVKNVHGNGVCAIALAGDMDALTLENVTCGENTRLLQDDRTVV